MAKVANGVKLTIGDYWEKARDTSAEIGALLLQADGLEHEGALADYDTVATILAGPSNEATFTNYTRKILPTVAIVRDDIDNSVTLTLAGDPPFFLLWADAGGTTNNHIGRIVYFYDPTPGGTTDAQLIHLASTPMDTQTDGSTIMVTVDDNGISRADDAS